MTPPAFHGGALDLIGQTPLVRLRRLAPNPAVEVWAKLESYKPGGSVKDRIARSMIEAAEMVRLRDEARARGERAESDRLREERRRMSISMEDTAAGSLYRAEDRRPPKP